MNYEKIYDSIIDHAKSRTTLTELFDKHHIIPRSMGGSDGKSNIVKLTLREHFVCHLLLAKIHGGGMLHAALMLSSFGRYGSRHYKWVRERYIKERLIGDNNPARRFPCTDRKRKLNSEGSKDRKWVNDGTDSTMAKGDRLHQLLSEGWRLGRLRTESLIEGAKRGGKLSGGYNKGVPMSEESKKHLSETNIGNAYSKGTKRTPEQRRAMSIQRMGVKQSAETIQTRAKAMVGVHAGKKYINKDGVTKHIIPFDVQSFLDDGWSLGKIKKEK
jgi:hypothetical protein